MRRGETIWDDRTTYILACTIPLGIPVGSKKSVGGITGTVYDAQYENKVGIANVVLTTDGATAVTGKNGTFVFPVLPPGSYPIHKRDS